MTEEPFKSLSVLVIDDNRFMRNLVRGVLNAFGVHDVREAADGASALQEWKHGHVDLIITELDLKTLSGIEFTRMARTASDSPNRYVPIIMLTAQTEKQKVWEARDAGINEFLAKPISAEALLARMRSALLHPRTFVETEKYVGPDRRRHDMDLKGRPDRRRGGR